MVFANLKMDLPSEDLEEYVEKFENVFLNHKFSKRNQNELLLLVENISSELQICRKSQNILRVNLKSLTESETLNINQKYISLEEKCNQLDHENKLLLKQNDELKKLMENELENQKNDYLNKIRDLQDKSQSEIINLINQLESNRICYETKEKELYNELQMSQAASALEWDDKEAKLKSQLADAKNNLRQCQNNVCRLRCEINQLQKQVSQQKTPTPNNTLHFQETPIQQVKTKLMQKLHTNESNNFESFEYYNQNQEFERLTSMPTTNKDILNDTIYNTSNGNQKRFNITQNLNSENRLCTFSSSTTEVNNQWRQPVSQRNNSINEMCVPNTFEVPKPSENRPSSAFSSATTIDLVKLEPNINNSITSKSPDINNKSSSSVKSYQTRSMDTNGEEPTNKCMMKEAHGVPRVHKGNTYRLHQNNLPPLKPCTNVKNANQEKKVDCLRKKRKLFDPCKSDYLP